MSAAPTPVPALPRCPLQQCARCFNLTLGADLCAYCQAALRIEREGDLGPLRRRRHAVELGEVAWAECLALRLVSPGRPLALVPPQRAGLPKNRRVS